MDSNETESKLVKITDLIKRNSGIIESHVLQLADWIKQKYQLEDALKTARRLDVEPATAQNKPTTPCVYCEDKFKTMSNVNYCDVCGRKL